MKRKVALGVASIFTLTSLYVPGVVWAQEEVKSEVINEHINGYIDTGFRMPSIYDDLEANRVLLLQSSRIPTSYDSRDYGYVTSVKNQGSLGTCWAHAAVASMESYAITHGYADNTVDFSEYALAYMTYSDDLYVEQTGDYTQIGDMYQNLLNGGSDYYAFKTLSKWGGVVSDRDDLKYNGGKTNETITNPNVTAEDISYVLTGQKFISVKDEELVKKAVMQNGAVATYYFDAVQFQNRGTYTGNEFVNYYTYYYNNVYGGSNHAVTIVGWDDTISKELFGKGDDMPSRDGAWLIKNSWGTWYGMDGYLWLSYDDKSIKNATACVYEVAPKDTYDHNYQHDGETMYSCGIGAFTLPFSTTKYANVFSVTGSKSQELKAVSFALEQTNRAYTVSVYKNPFEDEPESGVLIATTQGTTTYPGYYTVTLPSAYVLNPGETFSIVVEFEVDTELEVGRRMYYVGAADTVDGNGKVYNTSSDNQSYVYSKSSGKYIDTYDYELTSQLEKSVNVCIKAFTCDVDSSSLGTPMFTNVTEKSLSEISIGWQSVSGAESYNVYRKLSDEADYTCVASQLTETTFVDSVEIGKKYNYRVEAVATGMESSMSSILVYSADVPETVIRSATKITGGIKVTWDEVEGAYGYNLYITSNGNEEQSLFIEAGQNEYIHSNLKYNNTYGYKVSVIVEVGENQLESDTSSNVECAYTLDCTTVNSDKYLGNGKLQLGWDSVDDATGYYVYRIVGQSDEVYVGETTTSSIIDDITELPRLQNAYYRVVPYVLEDDELKIGTYKYYTTIMLKYEPVTGITWYVQSIGNYDYMVVEWEQYTKLDNPSYNLYIGANKLSTSTNQNSTRLYSGTYPMSAAYQIAVTVKSAFANQPDKTYIQTEPIYIGGLIGSFKQPVVSKLDNTLVTTGTTVVLTANLENELVNYKYSYQWYVSDSKDATGTAIEGATGKVFIPSTEEKGEKYYYVVVSAPYKGIVYTSESTDNRARVAVVDEILLGDVNLDGEIDIVDAVLVKQYIAGIYFSDIDKVVADMDCDGAIDVSDAVAIMQTIVGIRE